MESTSGISPERILSSTIPICDSSPSPINGLSPRVLRNPMLFEFFQGIDGVLVEKLKEFEKYLARDQAEDRTVIDYTTRIALILPLDRRVRRKCEFANERRFAARDWPKCLPACEKNMDRRGDACCPRASNW
jgi:hypothetical protein